MSYFTEENSEQAVLSCLGDNVDPQCCEVMQSIVKHLHAGFVSEKNTGLSPFHIDGAPKRAHGNSICLDGKGVPCKALMSKEIRLRELHWIFGRPTMMAFMMCSKTQ
jgi:hypothetical protein